MVKSAVSSPTIAGAEAAKPSQGSYPTIDLLSDSEGEGGGHSVYGIGSDPDEGPKERGAGAGRGPVNIFDDEDDHHTPLSTTRRGIIAQIEPIRTFIPTEIWLKILSFCHPTFLARARRVSRTFKTLIDDEKVWRCARLYHFPEYPDPILSIKEWEMWDLHLGVSCMICHAPKIRKRYWQFRIRCCKDCLKQGTIKEYILKERDGFKEEWIEYLIPGGLDSWGNWTTPFASSRVYFQKIFWLQDVKALEVKMNRRDPVSTKELKAEVIQAEEDILRIEQFEAKIARERGQGADLICRQRGIDIRERCSLLEPPLTPEVLSYIPAYKTAIMASRPLTDRAWKMLLKKLEAGREDAEVERAQHEKLIKEIGVANDVQREKHLRAVEFANKVQRARAIMGPWIDQFWAEKGGTITLGREGSFAVQALNFARKNWPTTEENCVPLKTVLSLWGDKLNRLLKSPGKVFVCVFCDQKFGLGGVFHHITATHPQDMGWGNLTGLQSCGPGEHNPSLPADYWMQQEWPEVLPIRGWDELFGTGRSIEGPSQQNQQVSSISKAGAGSNAAVCGKRVKDSLRIHMGETLTKIQPFRAVVSGSDRLFLWFRLSITSYLRTHRRIPDLTSFAHAANTVQLEGKDPIFDGLRCGVCNICRSKKRKPLVWMSLFQHFGQVHAKVMEPWTENFVMLPSRATISRHCSMILDRNLKGQWIELLKEADGGLAGMLDAVVQEDVVFSRREASGGVRRRVEVNRLSDPQEGGGSSNTENIGIAGPRELKRGREMEPVRDQECEREVECGEVVEHEKKKIKFRSPSPSPGDAIKPRDRSPPIYVDRDIEDLFSDARDSWSNHTFVDMVA